MSSSNRALDTKSEAGGAVGPNGCSCCLSFANTVHDYASEEVRDDLPDYAALVGWARECDIIDDRTAGRLRATARRDPRAAEEALAKAKALRKAVYRLAGASGRGESLDAADVTTLNWHLGGAMAGARLWTQGPNARLHWAAGVGLADAILWPIARRTAELLTSERAKRVVECRSDTCTWLVVDTTKNHSRKYCSTTGCGNRTRARRHHARHRAD